MMGGTLEEKQEAALEEAGEKEEWMETDPETWTDDQRQQFKEWEIKQQEIAEKNEKIRKMLR